MKKQLLGLLLISLSLMLLSCTADSPPSPVTGWVIGQTSDEVVGPNPLREEFAEIAQKLVR